MKLFPYLIIISFIFSSLNVCAQLEFEASRPIVSNASGNYSGTSDPIQIEKGDFNGDGHDDFVYGTTDGFFLFFLINDGNDKYTKGARINTGYPGLATPAVFKVIDANQDGTDEVVTTHVDYLGRVALGVIGLDNNSFYIPSSYYPFGDVSEIIVNDFNRDAKEDILVISASKTSADLYTSTSKGFNLPSVVSGFTGTQKSVLADLNGDGIQDVIASNSNEIRIYLVNSNATFTLDQTLSLSGSILGLTSADFNGDGLADVAASISGSNLNQLDYFVQSAGRTFIKKSVSLSKPAYGSGLEHTDINGDGKEDIVLGTINNNSLTVLTNLGNNAFSESSTPTNFQGAITDISMAGKSSNSEQLIACISLGNIFHTYKGNPVMINQILQTDFVPTNEVVADLNNDLLPDAIALNTASNSVAVSLNKGRRVFESPQYYQIGVQPVGISANDFNGDGYIDIAYSTNAGANDEIAILQNDGTGKFLSPIIISHVKSPSVSSGDFNNDQRNDLIDNFSVRLNRGNNSFDSLLYTAEPAVSSVVEDLTGDGFPEIIYDVASQNKIIIKYGAALNPFQNVDILTTTYRPTYLKVGDLNNDGKKDIVASNDSGVSVYWNRGGSSYQEIFISLYPHCGPISTGDLDNDGIEDLVVFTPFYLGIIQGRVSEQLKVASYLSTVKNADALEITDIDFDYKNDIIISGDSRLSAYFNNLAVRPALSPTDLLLTNLTDNSVALSWTRPRIGDGEVVMMSLVPVPDNPIDGVFYQSTLSYLIGSQLTSSVIVYSGVSLSNTPALIYGLDPDTKYFIKIVEFDQNSQTVLYGTNSLTGSFKTMKSQSIFYPGSYNGSPIPNKTIGDPSFVLKFVASSGLPLTYTRSRGIGLGVVTLEGDTVNLVSPGYVELKIDQDGNDAYGPAPTYTVGFCIDPPVPKITVTNSPSGNLILASDSEYQNIWFLNDAEIPNAQEKFYQPTENGIYSVRAFTDVCYSTSEPTPFIFVGLENVVSNTHKFYPNPFKGIISFTINPDESVKKIYITDVVGQEKMVSAYQVNREIVTIDLRDINNGFYYINVLTSKNTFSSKIIKSEGKD